jgi:hypothetical protein
VTSGSWFENCWGEEGGTVGQDEGAYWCYKIRQSNAHFEVIRIC